MWTRWKGGKGTWTPSAAFERISTKRACGRDKRMETQKGTTTSTISWRLVMKRVYGRGGRVEKGRRTPSMISRRDLQEGYMDEVEARKGETLSVHNIKDEFYKPAMWTRLENGNGKRD